MAKTINYTAALFSGTAAAVNPELEGDLLYGDTNVVASSSTPYVLTENDRDNRDDLLSVHEVEQFSRFESYVQINDDRENRDDLILQV